MLMVPSTGRLTERPGFGKLCFQYKATSTLPDSHNSNVVARFYLKYPAVLISFFAKKTSKLLSVTTMTRRLVFEQQCF